LVERDQFVRLRTGEATATAQQVVQAFPFGPVGCDEDVEVHDRRLLQALVRRAGRQLGRLALSGAEGRGDRGVRHGRAAGDR
jgi:hypothetical protein